ncbi:MAG: a-glycosyltransferase [Bacteroidetes bacterium]|nr:a-glycosyltransferase [Bacteroidota bacterium]
MQIVVNTRFLLKDRLDGIGWFSYQTLKRITQAHKDVHFVFLFDRHFDEEFIFSDNITPVSIGPQARHAFLFYAWYQFSVRSVLNKMKPDLFLSPDGMLALGAKCKQLPVIHDINFKHYPKDVPFWAGKFYNRYFPLYAQEAARIATVSEYSKKDLVESYKIDPDKIDVVYNGINENFHPLTEGEKTAIRKKVTEGKEYFVFVGSLSPRKNIKRLLLAFEAFKAESNSELMLVLAGAAFWGMNELKEIIGQMKHGQDVIFTGRLSEKGLNEIVASAFAMTYVPYFEGFGIPLVEAMQAEIPLISSNISSMPEVAGDAALYVNPFDTDEIKNAMLYLYNDRAKGTELIEAGKQQRTKFSWDRSADLLWKSIEKTIA